MPDFQYINEKIYNPTNGKIEIDNTQIRGVVRTKRYFYGQQ